MKENVRNRYRYMNMIKLHSALKNEIVLFAGKMKAVRDYSE